MVHHPWLEQDDGRRIVMVSGEGCFVRDLDGNEYFDADSGAWLSHIGHGRAELAEAAAAQMRRLEHFPIGGNFSTIPAIELAERLVDLAPPGIGKVRFVSSGSEGDDEALQLVRQFHHRQGKPERTVVLTLEGCFHGRTYGGAALRGVDDDAGLGPIPAGIEQLTLPHAYHAERFGGRDAVDFCIDELGTTIDRIGADRIAAMIAEPVLAPAGMLPLPDDYWPRVAALLAEHGILLVFDEVVTGFGRTGTWFAAEHYGISPDLIVVAKGIASGYAPLGAILLRDPVADVLQGADGGGSYGGHATACAVALANLDLIEKDGLVANSREVGEHLLRRLEQLREHPVVGNVRGKGLMLGIELVADKDSRAPLALDGEVLGTILREEHRVLAGTFDGVISLLPPLTTTRDQADRLAAAIEDAVGRLRPDGSVEGSGAR